MIDQIISKLNEFRISADEQKHATSGAESRYWEGRRDGISLAIAIARGLARKTNGADPSITIEVPIAYISSVAVDDALGPEVHFDLDACPANWDAASLPVPLTTAIRAAEMLETARENRTQTRTTACGASFPDKTDRNRNVDPCPGCDVLGVCDDAPHRHDRKTRETQS